MSYQGALTRLRADVTRQVLTVWRAYGLGRIDRAALIALSARIIAEANATAVGVADLAFSAELTRATATVQLPNGRLPRAYDQARLERGFSTLLDAASDGEDVTARLERFASAEPLSAATDTYAANVQDTPTVEGWVRQLDADPCQLCRWWWREGRVWPSSWSMQHHPGCECTQRIVVAPKIQRVYQPGYITPERTPV